MQSEDQFSDLRASLQKRIKFNYNWQKYVKPFVSRDIDKYRRASINTDKKFLQNYQFCSTNDIQLLNINRRFFSNRKLHDLLVYNFDSVNSMDAVSCFLHNYTENFPAIFNSFVDNQRLGEYSSYGIVFRSKFVERNMFDIIAIKYSQDSSKDNLLHELTVGYIMNDMREFLPNFIYTLAGFHCNKPILSNKRVLGLCYAQKGEQHIILERIHQGESMFNFIVGGSLQDILCLTTQVMLALDMAYEMFQFVHNDLHMGNVLIRNMTEETNIKYGNIYVKSFYVAIIIDYGMAQVSKNGHTHFDYQRLLQTEREDITDILRANNVYDINMFIMALSLSLLGITERPELLELGKILFLIFSNVHDLNSYLYLTAQFPRRNREIAKKQYYFLQILPVSSSKNYYGLGKKIVEYLSRQYPKEFANFYSDKSWSDQVLNSEPRSTQEKNFFLQQLLDFENIPETNQFSDFDMFSDDDRKYINQVLRKNYLDEYIMQFNNLQKQLRRVMPQDALDMEVEEATQTMRYIAHYLDTILHMFNIVSAMQDIVEKYNITDPSIIAKISYVNNLHGKFNALQEIIQIFAVKFVGMDRDLENPKRGHYKIFRELTKQVIDMYNHIQ